MQSQKNLLTFTSSSWKPFRSSFCRRTSISSPSFSKPSIRNFRLYSKSLKTPSSLHLNSDSHLLRSFSTDRPSSTKKVSILDLKKKFKDGKPISMVTAYDYTSGILVDSSGVDMILVGDSLGMVMLGMDSTTSVTVEDMIHHSKAVKRGSKSAFVVGDMPFGSYEASPMDAVRNATRLMKEGGVEAVKMEGGKRIKDAVRSVVSAGIPVMGHIGLTPQTCSALGGFRVQGKTAQAARDLLEDALELQRSGVFSIVIEGVPEKVATYITSKLSIPTIGIGAGNGTSGQVLVFHDMLGMYPNFVPKFCKQYATLSGTIIDALKEYKKEVELRSFPTVDHSYPMKEEEFSKAFPVLEADSAQSTAPGIREQVKEDDPQLKQLLGDASESASSSLISKESHKGEIYIKHPDKKTIAVIGGGAMGSLLGGRIAATGNYNVWMLSSWKDHVNKINKRGLKIYNLDKSIVSVENLHATTDVDEILNKHGTADLAIVMVKGPHTLKAAEKAAKILKPDGHILTLQNGIGNREIIAGVVGDERVIQGVTSQASLIVESGYIRHTGIGETAIAYQPYHIALVREIAEMLNRSNIPCELTKYSNLESMIWGKLIVNAGINPLTAILRVRNGVLASSEPARIILGKTISEGVKVADAKGVRLPFDDPLESVLAVARATSENVSSMLSDVMRGQITEVDQINGVIVREGEKLGVPVSLNKTICSILHSIEPLEVSTEPQKMYKSML